MIYLENIFVCLAIPLIIAACLLKGETRRFTVFFTLGLLACLLSAYINSFIAAVVADNGYVSLTITQAMAQITPICEEIMKALPIFFFVAAHRHRRDSIVAASLAVGLGFATFENCFYIMEYGSSDFLFALTRGFTAGVVHASCAAILGYGLALTCRRGRLAVPCAFALLCATSTFHAIYNLLVAAEDAWRAVGYIMPVITAVAVMIGMTNAKLKIKD